MPLFIHALNLTLQQLKFMEYSPKSPIKVTVYGERPREMRTKSKKDLIQAACLMNYLPDSDLEFIRESWLDARSRGRDSLLFPAGEA